MVIQRIQTLYLLIAAIIMGILTFMPTLNIGVGAEATTLSASKPEYTLLTLICLSVLVLIITIFRFKDLKAQMRLCKISMLLTVTVMAVVCAHYVNLTNGGASCAVSYWNALPPVALIMEMLAHKGMSHDKKLLSDSMRIR